MKRIIILLTLILALGITLNAEQVNVSNYANEVRLVGSQPGVSKLEFTLGSFQRKAVEIDSETWYLPTLKHGGLTLEVGLPEVPIMAGSIIIPPTAKMEVEILDSEYIELQMPIAPSKGNLTRDINPEDVPFSFSDFYTSSDFYPANPVELSEPFIIRDYRGITVRFKPFVYYPETGITRVYTKISVQVKENGTDMTNALSAAKNSYAHEFANIYQSLFLNFNEAKYPVLTEEGRILVIKHSMFDAAIQDWVEWKRQLGYNVNIVDVSEVGPSATSIKSYIQAQYDQNDGLMFVQIMGDAPQVPSLTYAGGGSDPSYSLLAGNDSYPDIYVGRFSAQTVAEMETQIERSVYYERDIQSDSEWLQKAIGIASSEGGGYQGDQGESDQQHMENIRNDLLNYGYTQVDQLYQNFNATSAQVSNSVNSGRGQINYIGHGSNTSWSTTGFNNTAVNNLVNEYELPFIISVACVNGNFVSTTCFAEAWLRATNNGNPTGAIAMYASSVNQSWDPPMRAQDEINDLLVADAKYTIGGLFFHGASRMIEVYGSDGADEFKNWHIFGDASLMARTQDPSEMVATYDPVLLIGMNSLSVQTEPNAKLSLSNDGIIYGSSTTDASGNAVINLDPLPSQPMDLTLTIAAPNRVTHLGQVQVLPADGPYIIITDIQVSGHDELVAEFDETITIQVEVENVGNDPAEDVTITLSTVDPYITVIGEAETIPDIAANATGSTTTGIDIHVTDFVPDQYTADFTVLVTLSNGDVYTNDYSLTINAPKIEWGYLIVDDPDGNNNNRIDPGESFVLGIPFSNVGHAESPAIQTSLIINGGATIISPILDTVDNLPIGAEGISMYAVTLSSQVTPGSMIQIMTFASYGGYTDNNIYNITVGIMADGFENGFQDFPWNFTGGDWTLDSESYRDNYAARSADINNNETTVMSVTMSNPADGIISFWKKVSSEENHDMLKFYINGQLKNQWSGEIDWSQVSYMVTAGTNTYRWEYTKDTSISSGQDAVWIDEVIFPAEVIETGSPAIIVDQTTLNFGNVPVGEELIKPFSISNQGNAPLLGSIQIPVPYTLDAAVEGFTTTMNFALEPGYSLDFNIGFRPDEEGVYDGSLIINSDDPENQIIIVPLTGSSSPVSNEDAINPVNTELIGNYPNPFNPTTTIRFSLKESTPVSITIYNILGQKVKTLVSGVLDAGHHSYTWDGVDANGRKVASGVYFYKMQSGTYSSTKKMIMMK
nr:hypothetical protein [Candidatus Cloacimonadota bacterium]